MALDAIVFDLDGTLVDTNALHVEAWERVFDAHGYRVAADRVFVEVGKGGDQLIPSLLGEGIDRKDGEAMRAEHPRAFATLARAKGIKPFTNARELLDELRRRGLTLVLATSSGEGHLRVIEEASGLKVREAVDAVVTSDDADQSKPAPDLVTAAVRKAGVSPAQAAMVGDTPWDAEAAKHAGVVCLGVTCGGNEAETLRRAGARGVWRDPADLLAHLDYALRTASPGPAHLTQAKIDGLMRQALATAREAMEAGEVPIGCVLVRGDGVTVVARGFNELNRTQNKTAHAEMVTFTRAAGKVPTDARDLILVSTLEPCVMCTGASMEAAVDTILYALRAPADSGTGRVAPPQSPESQMPRIVGGVLAQESRALFEEWLRQEGNSPQQVAFVKQLLSLT
jgi:HAD superfamily hydrolase (TIGR01509 family)